MKLRGQGETREARPNLIYAIKASDGLPVYPKLEGDGDGVWRWSQRKLKEERSIAGKTVHSIGTGTLLACLAPQSASTEVEPLAVATAILLQHGLENVRSL